MRKELKTINARIDALERAAAGPEAIADAA
jgi:hypothetical protein